jgi:hypothetical protein
MLAIVIIVAGVGALIVMTTIPALIFVGAFRAGNASRLPAGVVILVWVVVSVVSAGVLFIMAVVARSVDDSLTTGWIIANAAYPLVGAVIVIIHRRVLKSSGDKA